MCQISTRKWLLVLLRIYNGKQNATVIHFCSLLCALMTDQWELGTEQTPQLESSQIPNWSHQPVQYLAEFEVQIVNVNKELKLFVGHHLTSFHPILSWKIEMSWCGMWNWKRGGFFSGQISWNRLGQKSAGFFAAHRHTALTMIMSSGISTEGKCNRLGSLITMRRRWQKSTVPVSFPVGGRNIQVMMTAWQEIEWPTTLITTVVQFYTVTNKHEMLLNECTCCAARSESATAC